MEKAGKALNLQVCGSMCLKSLSLILKHVQQPHLVRSKMLYGPGDIEGHLGRDGKFYLLDFSRLFPPEAPLKG